MCPLSNTSFFVFFLLHYYPTSDAVADSVDAVGSAHHRLRRCWFWPRLGVKTTSQRSGCVCRLCSYSKKAEMLLKDIVPAAQNNIDAKFILLDKSSTTIEGQNKICLALVADETAAVHFQLWGDECDAFEPGDIIYLTNGIFSYHRNNLLLRAGKRGKVEKIGEFTMAFVETPNMSEIHWISDPSNSKKYVQECVISPHSRIFPPMP